MKTFTFENGVTVQLRKVAPLLLNQLKRSFAPPAPPVQVIDGPEGRLVVANTAHPDHLKAMADYHNELGLRLVELLIVKGIDCEVDQAAVDQLRAEMCGLGIVLPESDKIVYIAHLCVQSQAELERLRDAIQGVSMPTEEAIKEEVATFRP